MDVLKTGRLRRSQFLIQRSLDEPLSPADRKRLDTHLAGCESCRKAWDDYRRLSRAASQWLTEATTDPGDDFTQRIMADLGLASDHSGAVPRALDGHVDAVRPSSTRGRRAMPAYLAAVALAVLVIAGLFLPPLTHMRSVVDAYTPSIPTVPSTPAQWWSTVRPQAGEVMGMVQSWTWPLYAFAGAFIANVALALMVRRHRRAA